MPQAIMEGKSRFENLRIQSDSDSDSTEEKAAPPAPVEEAPAKSEEPAEAQEEKEKEASMRSKSNEVDPQNPFDKPVEKPVYVSDGDTSEEEDEVKEAPEAAEEEPKEEAAAAEQPEGEENEQAAQAEETAAPQESGEKPTEETKEEVKEEAKEEPKEEPKEVATTEKKKKGDKKKDDKTKEAPAKKKKESAKAAETPKKKTTKKDRETTAKKEKSPKKKVKKASDESPEKKTKKKATTPKKAAPSSKPDTKERKTSPGSTAAATGEEKKEKPKKKKTATTPAKKKDATTPKKKDATTPKKTATTKKTTQNDDKRAVKHGRELDSSRRSVPPDGKRTSPGKNNESLPKKVQPPKKKAPRQSAARSKSRGAEPSGGRALQADDPAFAQIRGQRRASSMSVYNAAPTSNAPFVLVAAGNPSPHFAPALEKAVLEHYLDGLVRLPVSEIERIVSSLCSTHDQKPVMNFLKLRQEKMMAARRSVASSPSVPRGNDPANISSQKWCTSSKLEDSSPVGYSVRRPASTTATRRQDVVKNGDRAITNFEHVFGNEVRAAFLEEAATVCLNRRSHFYREQPRMVSERGIVIPDEILEPIYIQAVNKLLYRMLGYTEQQAQKYSPDIVELVKDELPPVEPGQNTNNNSVNYDANGNNTTVNHYDNNSSSPNQFQDSPAPRAVGKSEDGDETDRISEPFQDY